MMAFDLQQYSRRVSDLDCMAYHGEVERLNGSVLEARGPQVGVGQLCEIYPRNCSGRDVVRAEVVGFRENTTILMPLDHLNGVQPGDTVASLYGHLEVSLGMNLLGRVLNGLGEPMDNGADIACPDSSPIHREAPHPLERRAIKEPLHTGIRAIDLPLALGRGQRMGIFAGAGVGKSTLLAQIARNAEADVNVITLVGERGREVGEFIHDTLGPEGLKKSVVVVATADAPPLMKVKAALTSTAIAEFFRGRGLHVLYMMDSLTRVANSQREIGLAAGEPPTARGYPPSVFSLIPALTERLGNSSEGSITGIYAVLVERDDMTEPVADAVRASLDGHIILSRELADRGHFPAIDVLSSVSRVMKDVVDEKQLELVGALKEIVSTYDDAEDLIKVGAYEEGSSPRIDRAIELMPRVKEFLTQGEDEYQTFSEARSELEAIAECWNF